MSMWKMLKKEKKAKTGSYSAGPTFDPKTGQRLDGTFDPKTGQRLDASGNPIVIADSGKGSTIDLRNSAKENKSGKKIEFRKSKIEMVSPVEGKVSEDPELQDNQIRKARALYKYVPEQEDEIALMPGKIIMVYEEDDSGWWTGECDGKYGLFPGGFVEMIEEEPSSMTKDTSSPRSQPSTPKPSNNNYSDMDMMDDEEFKRIMSGEEEKEKKKEKSTQTSVSLTNQHSPELQKVKKTDSMVEKLHSEKSSLESELQVLKKEFAEKKESLEKQKEILIQNQNLSQELSTQLSKLTSESQPKTSAKQESHSEQNWSQLKSELEAEVNQKKIKRDELFSEFETLQKNLDKASQEQPELNNLLEEAKKKAEEAENRVTRVKIFEENNRKLKVENEKLRKSIVTYESETDDKLKELWIQNKEARNTIRDLKATIEYDSPELEVLEESNRKLTLEADELKNTKSSVSDPEQINHLYKELRTTAETLRKQIRETEIERKVADEELKLREVIKVLESQLLDLKTNFDSAVERAVEQQSNPSSHLQSLSQSPSNEVPIEEIIIVGESSEETLEPDSSLIEELDLLKSKYSTEQKKRQEVERKLETAQEAKNRRPPPVVNRVVNQPIRKGTDPTTVVNKLGQKPVLRPRKEYDHVSTQTVSTSMSFQQKLEWFERLAKDPEVTERRRSIELNSAKSSLKTNSKVDLPKIDKNSLRRTQSLSPGQMYVCLNRKKEYEDVKEDVEKKFAAPEQQSVVVPITDLSIDSSLSATLTVDKVSPTTNSNKAANPTFPERNPTVQSSNQLSNKPPKPVVPPRPGGLNPKRSLWAKSVLMQKQ